MSAFEELQHLGTPLYLEPGQLLWSEGDAGDFVVLTIAGELDVVHQSADGEAIVLRKMGPGSLIGELACFDGLPRSATIRAASGCRLLRFPANEFKALLRLHPALMERIMEQQIERVRKLTSEVAATHSRAITDQLTKLYNFGFFQQRLVSDVERAQAMGDPLAVVLFDVDHFKVYNDTNGHQEGNVALIEVARLLRESFRRGDIVARYGGEEFIALLYGATATEALEVAESSRERIARFEFRGGPLQPLGRVSVSGGVAAFPEDGVDAARLIEAADRNLYHAKQNGRNRTHYHSGYSIG